MGSLRCDCEVNSWTILDSDLSIIARRGDVFVDKTERGGLIGIVCGSSSGKILLYCDYLNIG